MSCWGFVDVRGCDFTVDYRQVLVGKCLFELLICANDLRPFLLHGCYFFL
jgi:hypothetical protein